VKNAVILLKNLEGAFLNNRTKGVLSIVFVVLVTILVFFLTDYIAAFESLGYLGVFIISVLGSATIIIPAPSWTIVFVMSKILDPILLGIAAGTGSAIGELTGYFLGKGGAHLLEKEKNKMKKLEKYSETVNRYGAFAIFVFSFLPNPVFDIVGMAAGAMNMKVWKFLAASVLGKTLRFILFAQLGFYTFNTMI